MRRLLLLPVLALAAILALAPPASAKGPTDAVVDGEGMAAPINMRQRLGNDFWEVSDDLGMAEAMGDPMVAEVPKPAGPLGPRLTLNWQGPTGTGEFDIMVELFLWAEAGSVLHVLPGQDSMFTGTPTEDEWFPMAATAVETLAAAGVPGRDELVAAQRQPTTLVRAEVPEPDAFPWPTVLLVAALGVGGIGLAGWARRRTSGASAAPAPA